VLTTLIAALGLLLIVTAGCGDEDSDVTYPDRPGPVLGIWFLGVWGTGPDDVYVVGQPGLIFHWDGSSWSQQESGTTATLTDVWGDGSGTIYVTGHDGVILRSQGGGSWSRMDYDSEIDLFAVGSYQGQIYVCGRSEDFGQLSFLSGGTWNPAPGEIYQRDNEQAVVDTLYLRENDDPDEIIESLTSIAHHGVTGSDGVILMDDPETDWQLRRITGGQEWVTCSTSSDQRISGNFIATDNGRLYQLVELEGEILAWSERYSPALDQTIYGIHTGDADTVWAVANNGTVARVDPDNSFHPLYDDGLILFDIWGSSGTDLYAVGIEGRVLHFTDVGGEFQWVAEDLPLPEDKRHADMVFDKFGRPVD
jgi:hypothetical protein